MPSLMEGAINQALSDLFAQGGVPAIHYPADGGGPIACTVRIKARDQVQDFGGVSRTRMGSHVLKVRASEVEEPRRGDTFLVDSTSYQVLETPVADTAFRQIWTCSVAKIP